MPVAGLAADPMLELFHAAPSYYSMVARLALAEAGVGYTSRLLDIHLAKQQLSGAYQQLNPAMTVPTLRGPELLLTSSDAILAFAAAQAGESWADAEPQQQAAIQAAVDGHYGIAIETLTFSKLLASRPWLRPVILQMLRSTVQRLERQGDPAALVKAAQNRQRLQTFGGAPATHTLPAMRTQVTAYLAGLPPVPPGAWLFGPRISRADVVLAVLSARLSLAGELALLQRADLGDWWRRTQQRPAFAAAELWTRFRRRAFIAAVLKARHTPITV